MSKGMSGRAEKEPESLECDHCGGDAITSDDGIFYDGDGGACAECGFPGSVSADGTDDDEGDDTDGRAWWNTSQDENDRCKRADCEECMALPEPEAVER